MRLDDPETRRRLEDFIRGASGAATVAIAVLERMSGGAVQENWALDVRLDGEPRRWVLRTDAAATVRESLTRAQEFAVLRAVHDGGVLAPQPLYLCEDTAVTGRQFFIMTRLPGVAAGHRVTRETTLVPDPALLARQLAANLARLHRIRPPHAGLDFLPVMLACDCITHYRRYLDTLSEPYPVLEWGLRWCELNAPANEDVTLVHRDYRTGNYLVHDGHLAGVLDWEFPAFGNPIEDVGWLCARHWRFARPDRELGGIAPVGDFVSEYERVSGRRVVPGALRYWQVMANVRWAVIALQQLERYLSGAQPSLELALTGHVVGQVEWELLRLTGEREPEARFPVPSPAPGRGGALGE
ncbi:MAG: phosphotransferase family protein [Burkholderiales bacterium]|nr:phosphotransferase family protein [Burkholderiales bacterium]